MSAGFLLDTNVLSELMRDTVDPTESLVVHSCRLCFSAKKKPHLKLQQKNLFSP